MDMIDVAVELWVTAVTNMPTSIPKNLFAVALPIIVRIRLPAMFFSPSDIIFSPNKNRPSPPKAKKIFWTKSHVVVMQESPPPQTSSEQKAPDIPTPWLNYYYKPFIANFKAKII